MNVEHPTSNAQHRMKNKFSIPNRLNVRRSSFKPALIGRSINYMPHQFTAKEIFLIGVISDTHGHLGPEVDNAFNGMNLIIHAGDIGRPEVLKALGNIAPTVAVRGNMDAGKWARKLPRADRIEVGRLAIFVIHDLDQLTTNPQFAGITVVISGHTHQPRTRKENGVLYLNPGSASQPRYGNPASVAILKIKRGSLNAEFIDL